VPVPAHLLQQALAQPQAALAPARARAERRSWLAWLPQGSRLTWAAAAAALLLVIVPGTVLLTGDQLGWWGGEEPLSASPAPDIEPPKCSDTAEQQAPKETPTEQPKAESTDIRPPAAPPDCPPPRDKGPAEAPVK
jgi:hypothetical protein